MARADDVRGCVTPPRVSSTRCFTTAFRSPVCSYTRSWRSALVPARPGDLLGPIRDEPDYILVHVEAKFLPHVSDPAARARARASLVARAVDRAVNDLVVWHAEL